MLFIAYPLSTFYELFRTTELPGYAVPCRRCLSEGVDIFLKSAERQGGKRTRCPRQPIVDMDVDCRRPRHDENYSSLFVENSHPETLHRDMCIACSGSSSGLRLPPLRTMPIHKIVSKERCQSYFIDGCRRIKIERNNLLCEQAPTEVFRSIFAWLVARLTFYLLYFLRNQFRPRHSKSGSVGDPLGGNM